MLRLLSLGYCHLKESHLDTYCLYSSILALFFAQILVQSEWQNHFYSFWRLLWEYVIGWVIENSVL